MAAQKVSGTKCLSQFAAGTAQAAMEMLGGLGHGDATAAASSPRAPCAPTHGLPAKLTAHFCSPPPFLPTRSGEPSLAPQLTRGHSALSPQLPLIGIASLSPAAPSDRCRFPFPRSSL
eukprot:6301920-Prymnesium_polylepis.1